MPRYDVYHYANALLVTTVEAYSIDDALAKAKDWTENNDFETVDVTPIENTPWWAEPAEDGQ